MARWPFGLRRHAGEEEPARPAKGAPVAADGAVPPRFAWLRVPRLRPTVSWRAPVTVDVVHEPSAVRTRWLPRPQPGTSSMDTPRGRIRGVLRVLPDRTADLALPGAAGELPLRRPRPVRRPARTAPVAARPLTVVTEDNVEPPVEPLEPFIPAIALADLPWEHGWSADEDELGVAERHTVQAVDSPQVIDPLGLLAMGVAAVAEPPQEVRQRPTSLKRATLAESRRRGLGMPNSNAFEPDPPADSDLVAGDDPAGADAEAEPSPVDPGAPDSGTPADAEVPAYTVWNVPEPGGPPSPAGTAPFAPQTEARPDPSAGEIGPDQHADVAAAGPGIRGGSQAPGLADASPPPALVHPRPAAGRSGSPPRQEPAPREQPRDSSTGRLGATVSRRTSVSEPPVRQAESSTPSPEARPAEQSTEPSADQPAAGTGPSARPADVPTDTGSPVPAPTTADRPELDLADTEARGHASQAPMAGDPGAATGEPGWAGVQRAAIAPVVSTARAPLTSREILGAPGRDAGTAITATADRPVTKTVGVPTELATRVREIHAVDVSDAVVERGPAVSVRAHQLGARAFTEAGTVHLPAEAGDLTGLAAASLLAHELTHVAQQREFGAALPGEETEAGRQLEADALAVEQYVAGGPKPPPPLRHLARAPLATPATTDPAASSLVETTAPGRPSPAGEFDAGALQALVDQLSDVTTLDAGPAAAMSWSPSQGFSHPQGHAPGSQPDAGSVAGQASPAATVPSAVLEQLLTNAVRPSAGTTGPVVPVSALTEALERAGAEGAGEVRTVPAPALEQALERAVGAGVAISEPAVPEAVVRHLVEDVASGEPDGRPVVLASDVEQVIAQAAQAQPSPTGPVIPAAAISRVLAQATVQRPDGSPVVPTAMLAQALSQAVALPDAQPTTGDAVIAVADVERAMVQTALPSLSTWESRDATATEAAAAGDVVDGGAVLSGGTAGSSPPAPTMAPVAPVAPAVSPAGQATEAEPPGNWLDLDNTEHLDELTKKIYDRVHDRLRRDVLVQRERSGQLMDSW
jgi:hypothetical protein